MATPTMCIHVGCINFVVGHDPNGAPACAWHGGLERPVKPGSLRLPTLEELRGRTAARPSTKPKHHAVKVYLGGSLRNPEVRDVANRLRENGYEVFDDWHATSPDADDQWKTYEHARGRSFRESVHGLGAKNIFEFDKRHLDDSAAFVLVLPAGRSAHMELGYMAGKGRPTFVLFNEAAIVEERYDVMYNFATDLLVSEEELLDALKRHTG